MYTHLGIFILDWGSTVMLTAVTLNWLCKIAAALLANRPNRAGADIMSALSTLGTGVLFTVLPFLLVISISSQWPTLGRVWIDVTVLLVVFLAGLAYNIWDSLSFVVGLRKE